MTTPVMTAGAALAVAELQAERARAQAAFVDYAIRAGMDAVRAAEQFLRDVATIRRLDQST